MAADPGARTRGASSRAGINREIRQLAQRAGVSTDLVEGLIDRDASLEEARTAMFDNLLTRGATALRASSPPTIDDPAVFIRAAGETLYCRAAPHHEPSGPARQFMSMPLPEVARECLRRDGIRTHGLWGEALITRALNTTSDFPQILADTVGRTLRDAYQAAPSGIRTLGRETTAPDFRTRER